MEPAIRCRRQAQRRTLKKEFNAVYPVQFPWIAAVRQDCHSQPFADLQKAFHNFFKGLADRPVFKRKNKDRPTFYVANDKFTVTGKTVCLPIIGVVRMRVKSCLSPARSTPPVLLKNVAGGFSVSALIWAKCRNREQVMASPASISASPRSPRYRPASILRIRNRFARLKSACDEPSTVASSERIAEPKQAAPGCRQEPPAHPKHPPRRTP